jgi:DNA-binding response OmpR family regulator
MNKKILLLEDDALLGNTLSDLLTSEAYSVDLVSSGNEAIDKTYDEKFDLYIFDINVPDISGLQILESLRDADDNTPTIFISALVDIQSISKAFSIGADDYIKKPFFPEELLIRVKAKLSTNKKLLKHQNIELDTSTKLLKIDGHPSSLGEVQERLLEMFLSNKNQVLDKEILLECLEKPSATALRVAINKLKQTTGLNIVNVRGVGYSLE